MDRIHLFIWICIVWIPLYFLGCHCQFVITPRNSWVYVGQSVTLDCTIQNAGTMSHIQACREYITHKGGQVISSDGNVFDEKYDIVGKFNLKIKVAELSDGGTYSCEDAVGSQIAYKAELVVLESDPLLMSSSTSALVMENTEIRYTCQMYYQSMLIPVMKWTNTDGETFEHSVSNSPGYVETSIVITAGSSNNGKYYICQTYFEEGNSVDEYQASNRVSYSHSLATAILNVHYKPQDTRIVESTDNPIHRGSNIPAGEQIRCKSESNPPVQKYVWINMRNQQILSTDSKFIIGDDLAGELSLACTVTNYMGPTGNIEGTDTVVVSFNVIGSDSSETGGHGLRTGEIIAIALAAAVFLVVLIVIIILLGQRYNRITIFTESSKKVGKKTRTEIDIYLPAGTNGKFSNLKDGETNIDNHAAEQKDNDSREEGPPSHATTNNGRTRCIEDQENVTEEPPPPYSGADKSDCTKL